MPPTTYAEAMAAAEQQRQQCEWLAARNLATDLQGAQARYGAALALVDSLRPARA